MRPNKVGWWYLPEGEILEICYFDGEEIEIWRDGEILIPEEMGECWLPVPTRAEYEALRAAAKKDGVSRDD